MRRHLNTLYITSEDAYLRKEHETFVVEINDEKVFQAPIRSIENIVCFGFKPISPALLACCAENNIGVSFFTPHGRFLARVQGEQHGNVLLRKNQYALADSEVKSLSIARVIVAAKVQNYRSLLLRHQRNHPEVCPQCVIDAAESMGRKLSYIRDAQNLDELRGYEGECANVYFGIARNLFVAQRDAFAFTTRSKHPPLDPANAILSFLYALIANDIRSALETTGLDPQVGFLHRLRPGRPSLALDLMEEFRAYLGDRLMFNLVNLQQVKPDDFEIRESGEVRIKDEARKTIITAYQKRKSEEITHPFLGEKITVGLLPHVQAQLLARFVRGDIDNYPPFLVR